jgi:hypothetical protein
MDTWWSGPRVPVFIIPVRIAAREFQAVFRDREELKGDDLPGRGGMGVLNHVKPET